MTKSATGRIFVAPPNRDNVGNGWLIGEYDHLDVSGAPARIVWSTDNGAHYIMDQIGGGGYSAPGDMDRSTLVKNANGTYTITDK
jgi:hypothetical protein